MATLTSTSAEPVAIFIQVIVQEGPKVLAHGTHPGPKDQPQITTGHQGINVILEIITALEVLVEKHILIPYNILAQLVHMYLVAVGGQRAAV